MLKLQSAPGVGESKNGSPVAAHTNTHSQRCNNSEGDVDASCRHATVFRNVFTKPGEDTYVADMVDVVAFPLVSYCRGEHKSSHTLLHTRFCTLKSSVLGEGWVIRQHWTSLTVCLRLAEEDGAGSSVVRRVRLQGQFWENKTTFGII